MCFEQRVVKEIRVEFVDLLVPHVVECDGGADFFQGACSQAHREAF